MPPRKITSLFYNIEIAKQTIAAIQEDEAASFLPEAAAPGLGKVKGDLA